MYYCRYACKSCDSIPGTKLKSIICDILQTMCTEIHPLPNNDVSQKHLTTMTINLVTIVHITHKENVASFRPGKCFCGLADHPKSQTPYKRYEVWDEEDKLQIPVESDGRSLVPASVWIASLGGIWVVGDIPQLVCQADQGQLAQDGASENYNHEDDTDHGFDGKYQSLRCHGRRGLCWLLVLGQYTRFNVRIC